MPSPRHLDTSPTADPGGARPAAWARRIASAALLCIVPSCSAAHAQRADGGQPTSATHTPISTAALTLDPSATSPAPVVTVAVNPGTPDEQRAVTSVLSSLRPSSASGFAPEALAHVSALATVLPTGASVSPLVNTLDVRGDKASVDAVMTAPGQPDRDYWVFLERQTTGWVVMMTIPMQP